MTTSVPYAESAGLLTLFCDVSFCPRTQAAGYGAWYRTDGMEKGKLIGAQIPVRCANSNDGEFWGLVLSLRQALAHIAPKVPSAVIVECDNIAALAWLRDFHPAAKPVADEHGTHPIPTAPSSYPRTMQTAVDTARAMDPELKLWLKHVKGHDTKSRTARAWVNKQCDALAGEHMRARRGRP